FLAAAWVTLLTEALVMGLAGRAVLSALGLRPRLGRIARAVVAATAMGALVGALRGAGAPIGLLMAAAAVSYPLLALIAGAVSLSELRSLMARQAP
ncbi:MAG TPA: hypothetical protein VGN69_08665, partial [Solirubrobacteraceae bacterium]|nr:hypothetical protein [Solirubrobacteraceae bacterium]